MLLFRKLHYQRRAAVAEKRQADTCVGYKIADNCEVEDCLYAYLSGDTYSDEHTEAVLAAYRDRIAFNNKKEEYDYNGKCSREAQLLAYNRENKVVFCLGEIEILLTGVSETKSEKSARTDSYKGVSRLP